MILSWSLARIESRVGRAAWTQLSLTVLVLGGSWILLRHFGTDGVGLAWLGGNLAVAAVRIPSIARVMRYPPAVTTASPQAGHAPAEQPHPTCPAHDFIPSPRHPSRSPFRRAPSP